MSTGKSFSIGQVVYILSNKGQSVIPAMVIEEATVQTLEGKKVSWKFAIGATGKQQKIVDSNQIEGDVFTSLDEVKQLLTARLSKFIDELLNKATQYENAWFGAQIRKAKEAGTLAPATSKIDPQSLLEDMNMSANNYFADNSHLDPKETAKQKIREMVAVDDEEDSENTTSYIDEHGVKVRVHIQ